MDIAYLSNHHWSVPTVDGKPCVFDADGFALALAFTTEEDYTDWLDNHGTARTRPVTAHLRQVRGVELFAAVASMTEADGLQINPGDRMYAPLAPYELIGLAKGVDNRFDTRVLRAHTIAEIHTFLDQMQVYRMTIEHEMVYRDDILVARYRGVAAGGRLVSFDFTPGEPTDDPLHIGVHKSEILCSGWLASKLSDLPQVLPHDPAELTGSDVELLHNGMRWIAQLWAQLDGRQAIPRIELRTVVGAAAVRKHPEIVTQDYIDSAFSQLVDREREREVPTP